MKNLKNLSLLLVFVFIPSISSSMTIMNLKLVCTVDNFVMKIKTSENFPLSPSTEDLSSFLHNKNDYISIEIEEKEYTYKNLAYSRRDTGDETIQSFKKGLDYVYWGDFFEEVLILVFRPKLGRMVGSFYAPLGASDGTEDDRKEIYFDFDVKEKCEFL